jgi:FAD/FMN-containing dehydrogenase
MDILIVDNKAQELFPNGAPELHPSAVIIKDFQGDVETGWEWNGSSFAAPIVDETTTDDFSTVRIRRDEELAASDWIVVKSLEAGVEVPTVWKEYRQALRDLPAQEGWPEPDTWPQPPAE